MIEPPWNTYPKIALILAGGTGKKLWPYSTENCPEQFVNLMDDKTMFQRMYDFINNEIKSENIWIVTHKDLKSIIKNQRQIPDGQIITEPLSRQTATAVGLAITLLDKQISDDTLICIFPSDQLTQNIREFNIAMDSACEAAYNLDAIITIGIEANRPETHFGYIQLCDKKDDERNKAISNALYERGLRKSINFAEKPDKTTASRFINSGDFVWNSGIIIIRKKNLLNAYKEFLPYQYEKFKELKQYINTPQYEEKLSELYKILSKVSLDYGILENAKNIYVIKSSFTWSDFNDWKELHRVSTKDANDNVLSGNILTLNTTNTLAISNDKFIALYGVDDLVVVNTEKAILVCKKSEAEKVSDLVDLLIQKNIPLY